MRAAPGRGALGPCVEAVVPCGHRDARGQPLDVPLERAGQRLVEVVHVEHQPPVQRAEHAEVEQVRVAAQLHPDVAGRQVAQVPGHRRGRAAVVGERRGGHPAVPDRHQVGYPLLGLGFQDADRIGAAGRRRPFAVRRPGHKPAPFPASAGATRPASVPGAARTARPALPSPCGHPRLSMARRHPRCPATVCSPSGYVVFRLATTPVDDRSDADVVCRACLAR